MLTCVIQVFGQNDTTVYEKLKTKKYCSVQLSYETGGRKDVNAMLKEVEIPKGKEANFTLTIYNDGKAIERVHINVKR